MATEERYHPGDFGWRVDWNEKYNKKWIDKHNLINLSKDLSKFVTGLKLFLPLDLFFITKPTLEFFL